MTACTRYVSVHHILFLQVGSGRPASARAAAFESMLTHRLTVRAPPELELSI